MGSTFDEDGTINRFTSDDGFSMSDDDEPFGDWLDELTENDWLDEITENKKRYRDIPISPEGFVIVSLSIVFFILLSRILFH